MTTTVRTRSWERRAAAKRARLAAVVADDPRYVAPPADVRAVGLRAMVAATEATVDVEQVYDRTLAAVWPQAVAAAQEHIDAQLDTEIGPEVELAVEQLVDADTAPVFWPVRVPAPTTVDDDVPVWGVPDDEDADPVPPVSIDGAGGGMVALDSGPLSADDAELFASRIVAAVRHLRGQAPAPVDGLAVALARVEASEQRLADAVTAHRQTATTEMHEFLALHRAVLVAVAWLAADYTEVVAASAPGSAIRAMADRAARALYDRLTRQAGSDEQAVLAEAHEQRRAARRAEAGDDRG